MKFNKWTVGLAAVGVVSLASAAKAEERANTVQTALSSTTISGYVDTSAQWNFGTGNENNPPYKFGGADKADGFNLNVVQLRIEKPLDETEWAAGYRADLWLGPDANTLNTQSILSTDGADFAVRQAYVALRLPVANGIDLKMGAFDSIIGYESVESPNNPNYTRSYGHSIEPQTHTGLLATYRFSDLLSASAGIANTVQSPINSRAFFADRAESYKSYMASIALTAPDDMGFLTGSTLYAGIVNGFGVTEANGEDENVTSYYVGATIATPVTGLRAGAALDVLDVHESSGETWALSGYASFQATEKLSLHARAEYLKDRGEQKVFVDDVGAPILSEKVLALTATAQYDLWKNVISRLELRWDHSLSGDESFGSDAAGAPDMKNAWMLAANVIYKF